jgi:hypothetical protein
MIFPIVPMGLTEKNLHPILCVYSRKFTSSDRSGLKHCFTALYVDHNHPRPLNLGEPGPT